MQDAIVEHVNGILTVKGLAHDVAGEAAFYFIGSCRLDGQYRFGETALIDSITPHDGVWSAVLLQLDAKGDVLFKDVRLYLGSYGRKDVETWERALQGSSRDQNAVGWGLSFGRKKSPIIQNTAPPHRIARYWFARCAQSGDWAGNYNLGVMLSEGLGGERDAAGAFSHLKEAARSFEPVSLRRYAACYRNGVGCMKDDEIADVLEMLASFVRVDGDENDEDDET